MKYKIFEKLKEGKWEFLILAAIIAAGIFLRVYNFSDWLHFELDQAYDAYSVSPALENGIQNLPLFGTNVGGGTVRLGPAFYYMEYLSAFIFGNTAPGHAAAVLLMNIAALPLFYFFSKRYFSKEISLGLTTIFSFSLFSILYSRFSWSPNVLPFLILLAFYALLRAVSESEKHPARWFLISVATVSAISQIHLNSFFVIPAAAVIFTAIKRPKFHWKVWLAAIAIIFIIYSPMIASDIKTNGANLKGFKSKVLKTNGVRSLSKVQTFIQSIEYDAYEYFFIVTGNDQINGTKLKGYGFACDDCKKDLGIKIFALVIFIASFAILVFNLIKEKIKSKRDFLLIIFLWFTISSYLFYTIARTYRMYPRFYLLISPLAIILFGLILKYIKPEINKKRAVLFVCIIAAIAALNLQKTASIFNGFRENSTEVTGKKLEVGDIFPDSSRLTYGQEKLAAEYIEKKYIENGFPVYIQGKSDYKLPLWFILEQKGIDYYDETNEKALYRKGNYFDIRISSRCLENYFGFEVKEFQDFGTMTVCYLSPRPQNIAAERQPDSEKKISKEMQFSILPTWRSLFIK